MSCKDTYYFMACAHTHSKTCPSCGHRGLLRVIRGRSRPRMLFVGERLVDEGVFGVVPAQRSAEKSATHPDDRVSLQFVLGERPVVVKSASIENPVLFVPTDVRLVLDIVLKLKLGDPVIVERKMTMVSSFDCFTKTCRSDATSRLRCTTCFATVRNMSVHTI